MNKYLKLANYFDSKGLYKSADSLELFVKKAQGLSFIEKQPDLAKIEKSNKIANDIVYYAASVSQGTRTPSYDPKSFFTTIQKIESMKNNPDVQTNFPNIYSSLDAAIELLKSKSIGQTPGSTPGASPNPGSTSPNAPDSAIPGRTESVSRPPANTPEGVAFDAKVKTFKENFQNVRRYLVDIKRHTRSLELAQSNEDQEEVSNIQMKIKRYYELIDYAMLIIDDPEFSQVRKYLKSIGEFDPNQLPESEYSPDFENEEGESTPGSTNTAPAGGQVTKKKNFRQRLELVRKSISKINRFKSDIERHNRDIQAIDMTPSMADYFDMGLRRAKIDKIKKIISNYISLIENEINFINDPKNIDVKQYLINSGELDPTTVDNTSPEEENSENPEGSGNNPRSEAGKILDEAYPTYSSRDPKPDQRLPGLSGTGFGRELDKVRINNDYMKKFPPIRAGLNETDPAGGPKLTPEQLSIYGVDPKDILVSR